MLQENIKAAFDLVRMAGGIASHQIGDADILIEMPVYVSTKARPADWTQHYVPIDAVEDFLVSHFTTN